MPNWVQNELFVISEKADRQVVRDLLENAAGETLTMLDFDKVVRMPDGYFWTESPPHPAQGKRFESIGVIGDDPLSWEWSRQRQCKSLDDVLSQIMKRMREYGFVDRDGSEKIRRSLLANKDHEIYLLQPMLSAVLMLQHGYSGWSEWSKAKWGTHWNAHDTHRFARGSVLRYAFKTAWSPPRPWLKALGIRCPEVALVLKSSDPDMGWHMTMSVQGKRHIVHERHKWPRKATISSAGSKLPPKLGGERKPND